jgi:hypothetical protein
MFKLQIYLYIIKITIIFKEINITKDIVRKEVRNNEEIPYVFKNNIQGCDMGWILRL